MPGYRTRRILNLPDRPGPTVCPSWLPGRFLQILTAPASFRFVSGCVVSIPTWCLRDRAKLSCPKVNSLLFRFQTCSCPTVFSILVTGDPILPAACAQSLGVHPWFLLALTLCILRPANPVGWESIWSLLTIHQRLNVYVPTSPNSYVETLTAKVMVFGGGALGRWWGHEGGSLIREISALYKRRQRAPSMSQEECAYWTPHLPGPQSRTSAAGQWEINGCCLQAPPFCGISLQQPELPETSLL